MWRFIGATVWCPSGPYSAICGSIWSGKRLAVGDTMDGPSGDRTGLGMNGTKISAVWDSFNEQPLRA